MTRRRLFVVALCVSLLAFGGRASADIIIDENFDANNLVDTSGRMVPVNGMMAMMWLRHMNAPFGMWFHTTDMGMMPHVIGGMTMGMMSMEPWWRTLTYFMGMPAAGWGGNMLDFSFMYMVMIPMGSAGFFGVYGWPATGAEIDLESMFPGSQGTELMSGQLDGFLVDVAGGVAAQEDGWSSWEGSYFGDLGRFAFIGVTFTFGVAAGGASPPEVHIDTVRLETRLIPEPATMCLVAAGLAAAAYARRRRRRSARGSGPPG